MSFRASLGPDELLAGVGEVLRAVAPDEPELVSQSAFDAERGRVAGMPTATTAARRLGLSWEKLREVALAPDRQRSRLLGLARRREEAPPDDQTIRTALQTAAAALGQRTLRPHEYAGSHKQLEEREARAWKHGTGSVPLPTTNQILTACKSEQALRLADLDPLPASTSTKGEDPERAARAFVEAFGVLPANRPQLELWFKHSEVALARFRRKWSEIRAEILAEREAAGLPPLAIAPRGLEADPERGAPRAPGTAVRRRKRWTDDEVIEGVALALDELKPGERLTERQLGDLSRGRPDIPTWGRVSDTGLGLEEVKRRAEALRRAR
jgi:hypothetical protein